MEEIQTLEEIRKDLHNLRKNHMKTTDIGLRDGMLEITDKISRRIGCLKAKNRIEEE